MNILAAFIFFTRLPFWKIKEVPAECFKHVVPYWSLTGWLTGGIMAGTLWITGQILPISIAWITAIIVRLLVTGCLHEDGLADFLDGFGGGTTRERTLCMLVLCGDCWSKFCASQLINYLPYARKEEDSKAKVIYNRMSWHELLTAFICGLLPLIAFLPIKLWPATLFPLLTFILLYRLM